MTELTPTENALNLMHFECCSDYGGMCSTLDQATPETIGQFRARDLFILRSTVKYLPEITDSEAEFSLASHASHMNTYDGAMACLGLLAQHFNGQVEISNMVKSCTDRFNQAYKQRWKSKFGENPIKPEDYAPGSSIPTERPLPPPRDDGQEFC